MFEDMAKDTVKGSVLNKMVDQFRLGETQVQFNLPGDVLNPPGGERSGQVPVEVANGVGIRNTFAENQTVQVDISGGTASGKQLQGPDGTLGAVDGSLVVTLKDGQALVTVLATSTGTVNLALSNPSKTTLQTTDTAVVTFS